MLVSNSYETTLTYKRRKFHRNSRFIKTDVQMNIKLIHSLNLNFRLIYDHPVGETHTTNLPGTPPPPALMKILMRKGSYNWFGGFLLRWSVCSAIMND